MKKIIYGVTCIGLVCVCAGLGMVIWLKKKKSPATVVISGTDGPTSVFLAGKLKGKK